MNECKPLVVGTKIVFCPNNADHVGVLDTSDNSFNTIATGVGSTKYWGGAAVGTRVVCAPYTQNNVGVFDTADNTFTTFNTTGVTGNPKYRGAAVVGAKVYFGPVNEDNVGVFDTSADTFSSIAITVPDGQSDRQIYKYSGAVAVGTKAGRCRLTV